MASDIDLLALVIKVRAPEPRTVNHLARALQQRCLAILDEFDRDLAARHHTADHALRPYTTAGPFWQDSTKLILGRVNPDETLWIRLTAYETTTAQALLSFAETVGETIELNHELWHVDAVLREPSQWSNLDSYAQLISRHIQGTPPEKVTLQFASPTTFKSLGVSMPLPSPQLVFGSLIDRWTTFVQAPLPEELAAFVNYRLEVSKLQGTTQVLQLRQPFTGFTGQVTYRILKSNDSLRRTQPDTEELLRARHKDLASLIGMLSEFAFYSGVGTKTTTGMGMARSTRL